MSKGAELVCTHHQKQLCARVFDHQFTQCIYGVSGTRAHRLACIHLHFGHICKGQPGHGQPVQRRAWLVRLMPRLPGWENQQSVKLQLLDRCLCQGMVCYVGRVKSAAVHANAVGLGAQTQSFLTKNFLYKSSSGEPARLVRL